MTPKNALYILVILIIALIIIRFIVFLTRDRLPTQKAVKYYPTQFPICQGSTEIEAVKNIQRYLNKNMKSMVTVPLIVDGNFGGMTEWQLKDQTGSICVSETMYPGMV